uniref:Uncharacterized protein n=1 Tax=Chaetoceros debilis TaxID=122233 RepID=A0A7S3VGH4_9STRA|mmetsp:Transcript_26272/g.38841  ORF Transcript_26272/g.38841 Transcript_26272/m.38841 type:complete len:189 (+) Transcript_26272:37-603(+)
MASRGLISRIMSGSNQHSPDLTDAQSSGSPDTPQSPGTGSSSPPAVAVTGESPSSDIIHDDDMTEINLDEADQISGRYISRLERTRNSDGSQLWTAEEEESYEEQRRINLTEELVRIQRTNFIHFSVLCSIPLFLLALVLVNSFQGNEECVGLEGAECQFEQRIFMNAFSKRCICKSFVLEHASTNGA